MNEKKLLKSTHENLDGLKNIISKKIISLATETGKQEIISSDRKVLSACLMRNLFGSILYILLQRKVDMAQVLKYSLTRVPLS